MHELTLSALSGSEKRKGPQSSLTGRELESGGGGP